MPYSLPMKFKMTKRDVLKRAKKILQEEGVTYELRSLESCGWAYPKNSHIVVGTFGYNANQLASVFCHELAHILNFRNKKYFRYHNYGRNVRYSVKLSKIRIKIGLRAEIYTDKVAKMLMERYYPGVKFIPSYSKKWQRDWYKQNMLAPCKEFLKETK